ncbi:oxygen-dependent coproporphyrinogen oxidase [Bacillus mesophilum]|uniref:coproporphyrinogen oxidase n=1 Tax=Bacillus mesophilum TaxID=1071718 RepID=A0A7V7UVJ3_9BACI|nr:oxygen-dependent coproporphyrinogen oxidase [Bacillus mesophilum]KAB2332827.1 oxygen-dependent coproporphyrinogen oxidase [Bacillus mesophilum]
MNHLIQASVKVDKDSILQTFKNIQDDICQKIELLDGSARFHEDQWDRPGGGGGRARVIENGQVFEKGGVNFSHVYGALPETMSAGLNLPSGHEFLATGVSIIMHPVNPYVPIIHMNVRYFEMSNGDKWFGGGIDLTPIYIDEQQADYFHRSIKHLCDQHDSNYYPTFKEWADRYFYIKHRQETRGIGGIFFDRLRVDENTTIEKLFDFVKDVGDSFVPIYSQLVEENQHKTYGEAEKEWQYVRRSRYAEFNLIYDRGTKFGLDTNGRIESIFMSLPPQAKWLYNYQVQPGSMEARTLSLLKKDVDWIKE